MYICTENPSVIYPDQAEPYLAETMIERHEDEEALVRNMLTAYFELNSRIGDERLQYTYATIANRYLYDRKTKTWEPREKPLRNGIIRIAHVSPGNNELHVPLYFTTRIFIIQTFVLQAVRALAYHVRGPRNWKENRTVQYDDGTETTYNTCVEAAIARGLLSDNQYVWRESAAAAMQQILSLKRRVNWMVNFLYKCRPIDPLQIVQDNLSYLAPSKLPEGMRQDYFLRRLEFLLRYAILPFILLSIV